MLRPEEMSKITVIGPKSLSYEIVDRLHKLKVYHIVDHKKTEELDIGSPLESSEKISSILVKARAICSFLGIDLNGKTKAADKRISLPAVEKNIEELNNSIMKKSSQLKEIEEKSRRRSERKLLVENIAALDMDIESFYGYSSIGFLVGFIENAKFLEDEIKGITERYKLRSAFHKERNIVSLFFDREKRADIADRLSKRGFSEIDVSFISAEDMKGSASKELQKLEAGIRSLEKSMSSIRAEIKNIKKKWSDYLVETESILSVEAEKAGAPLRFGSTDGAFVIKGWVPSKKLQDAVDSLNRVSKNRIFISTERVGEHDDVPIKLKNPKAVSPFEWFIELYTLPQYHEIDPTFLMFLTFPLFYGFMLGDMGYGLVVLPLFLYLRKKVDRDFRRLVDAMTFAAVSSIIFGFLFGEFFGLEKIFGYELFHIISRSHQTKELMVIAIAIGAVHLNIGLLVGFYNELRAHGFVKAVLEKISWIVLEAGVAMLALSYMKYITMPMYIGYIIIGVSVVMLYLGEGPKGIVELPSIFSQMMSYTRLMAVGLASVILAEVINELAGEVFHAGIFGIIGGIVLLVVGHAINIALGLISPFLHSLRLHYVEFFTKFYHGGGMRYVPFGTEKDGD